MTAAAATALAETNPARPLGYYGIPVIHGPHWKWLIIAYFFFGGISGSSAALAAIARLVGGTRSTDLARTATYVAIAALAPCPAFLILDLGRPARFLNMLRAFRPTSPMSMGTWGLSAYGLFITLATLLQLWEDLSPSDKQSVLPAHNGTVRLVALLSGAGGLFVAGYTGVLLAATAVPIWSKSPGLLGPLFVSSAMSSGLATISLATALRTAETGHLDEAVHTLETAVTIAEGSLLAAWLLSLGPTAKPLLQGSLGYVVQRAVVGVGMAAPPLLSLAARRLPKTARRATTIIASALTLAGVFALRYAVVEGGRQSADDPQATFDMTG